MSSQTNTLTINYIDSWTIGHLKNEMNASNEELMYFDQIKQLRDQKSKTRSTDNDDDDTPSVVIDDFLYHGDMNHASNMKLLTKLGIRHILNTCDSPLETEITKNFNVLWINVVDDLSTDIIRYFQETNDFLFSCKQKKEKVLVHCHMGISRSSSVVLAYLMK